MSESDYVRTLLESFCQATGRLVTSPADYALVQQWRQQGIPLSVAWRGVQDKLRRCEDKKYRPIMPLSWCEPDVRETFANWRRAVGPRWKSALDSRAAQA